MLSGSLVLAATAPLEFEQWYKACTKAVVSDVTLNLILAIVLIGMLGHILKKY